MKRNAADLKYNFHVIKWNDGYKVRPTFLSTLANSLASFKTREEAQKYIDNLKIKTT